VAQADSAIAAAGSVNWRMQYGNSSRTGHMRSLPAAAAEADLAELWSQEFDVLLPQLKDLASMGNRTRGAVMIAGGPAIIRSSRVVANQGNVQPDTRESLVKRWKDNGWFPTGHLLFDADESASRVYVK